MAAPGPDAPYSLRKALPSDARVIRGLVHRARLNPTGLDWHRFMIAVDERGRFAGCAQVKRHHDGSRELASLAVLPPRRGDGIGSMLIEHFLASTRRPLYLMCRPELGRYYARFGFARVRTDRMPRHFRRIDRVSRLVERIVRRPGPLIMVHSERTVRLH